MYFQQLQAVRIVLESQDLKRSVSRNKDITFHFRNFL